MTQHHEHDLPASPLPADIAGAIAGGLPSDTVLHFEDAPLPGALSPSTHDLTIPGGGQAWSSEGTSGGFDEIPAESLEAAAQVPVATQAEAEEDNAQSLGFLPASKTTQQDHEVFFPLEGEWNDAGIFMVGQADTQERTTQALDLLPNLDLTATEDGRDWVDFMRESINIAPNKDQWRAAADRLGSAWRQQVESQRGQIKMGALSFKNVDGAKLTGEKAVIQVLALMGLGSVIQIPLWHSGFHVTVKAPGEPAMLELNRRLTDEKVVIGRTTNGLAFANTSSYMSQTILDFTMDYIYDTSLQEKDKGRIRGLIEAPDLPILFWGLACAVWPRGFQYARPYIDPVTKQEKMLREKLAIGKLLWVDTKSLTAWQISHMANRGSGQMALDTVKRYKAEFTIGEPRLVKLSPHISVTLRVPTADEYVIAGAKWIGDITRTADEAFSLTPEDNRRANYIVQQGKATAMRQYSHWVHVIHVGSSTIEDRETIDNTLATLSCDDDLRSMYFNEIQKYIDDVTMAIIATPTATQAEEKTFPKFPHLLPMNVEHTFFTLLEQKATQISQRN
jgi:hypothetical protein